MRVGRSIEDLRERLKPSETMPVVFVGHGSPMNVIEDNPYKDVWMELGATLPRPQAVVVVSAHWMSREETLVDVSVAPRTIHDFGAFPEELYAQQYPAPGAPDLAGDVVEMLRAHGGRADSGWGLDHGAWAVLKFLYPEANIPVFQVSIDMARDLDYQLEVGRALAGLRERGVLILGSGNVVHNLRTMDRAGAPQDFAVAFDALFAERLAARDFDALVDRAGLGQLLDAAHPSVDHYLPALTVAGASDGNDALTYLTESIDLGSIAMRSFVFSSG